MSTEADAMKTKHKIARLIEKHIITTKIGHLLRALDNCKKTTNTNTEDKTGIYATLSVNDKENGESKTHYKIEAASGKNVLLAKS